MVNQPHPQEQEHREKNQSKKGRLWLFGVWIFVAIFLAGLLVYSRLGTSASPCRGAVNIVGNQRLGGAFTALDGNGRAVMQDDVIKEPSLIYFGYTFCPDVCPIDTARNAEVTDILAERGIGITPIFITIDPARDTPQVMKDFAYYSHEKMIGLSGSSEEIEHLKSLYKVYGEKQESDDPENYLVDHSAFSYLVNPGGFIAAYSRASRAEEIADDIECQIKHLDD